MDKPIPEAVRQLTMIRDGYAAGPIVQAEKVAALDTAIETLTAAQQQGQAVAWMRRTATYRSVDGRSEGERIVSEQHVYPDDIPLYLAPPSEPVVSNPALCPACKAWPVDGNKCLHCGNPKPFAQQPAAVDRRHPYVQSKDHGGCANCGYPEWEPWHALAAQHQEPTT